MKSILALLIISFLSLAAHGQHDAMELTREQQTAIQHGLVELGHDPGTIDGSFGNNTRAAIWDWQNAGDVPATGYLSEADAELLTEAGLKRMASMGLNPFREDAEEKTNPFRAISGSNGNNDTIPPPVPEGERILSFDVSELEPSCTKYPHFLYGETNQSFPNGDGCWIKLTNILDCHLFHRRWHGRKVKDEQIIGDGECRNGKLSGIAKIITDTRSFSLTEEGSYTDGKREGEWRIHREFPDGQTTSEGSYIDGKREGEWDIVKFESSNSGTTTVTTEKGHFINNKAEGMWSSTKKTTYSNGVTDVTTEKGPYVNGRKHGHWTIQITCRGQTGSRQQRTEVLFIKGQYQSDPGYDCR